MAFKLSREELMKCGEMVRELHLPSVASLYGVFKDRLKPAKLSGSGTFVQHRDDIFVLTAIHVVVMSKKFDYVFHDIGGNGENMFPFRGNWTGWKEKDGDLALWGCFSENFSNSIIQPLQLVEPFGSTNINNDSFYITTGFPEELSSSLPFMGEYRTTFHTVMGKNVTLKDLPKHCFSFDCANDIKYFGMSGSAVWSLNFHQCRTAGEWKPSMSTFAGVTIRWEPKGNIIATKAETVKRFLSNGIERLRISWKQGATNE